MRNWQSIWTERGGFWRFTNEEDPADQPHAVLTSGKHSDGYANSRVISADPALCDQVAEDLQVLLKERCKLNKPAMIFAPESSAPPFARALAGIRGIPAGSIGKEGEINLPAGCRQSDLRGMQVIVLEDVITTGGSVRRAVELLKKVGAVVLPYIPVLLNRSSDGTDFLKGDTGEPLGMRILPLVKSPMNIWPPTLDECPLCAQGSMPLRPKDHWSAFSRSG
ncbi:MAG: phosphoribosyltransferase family protein [Candidatus Paceibacterota bacterium]